jgi:poly(A) polymerase
VLREALEGGAGPGELGYRLGVVPACDVLFLRAALAGVLPDPEEVEAARRGAEARFPLRAADLMDRHSGPALGRKLAELETDWIASGFALSRAELLALG